MYHHHPGRSRWGRDQLLGPLDTLTVHPRSQDHREKPGGFGGFWEERRDSQEREPFLQAAGWAPPVLG